MATTRVVHYLNQFFAGIGAEAKADMPPGRLDGPAGPGRLLQQALGEGARVVATVYCGDNYAGEKPQAVGEILDLIAEDRPDIVIAGPAFSAGRYGLACGEVAARARARLGVTVVTGMHADNGGRRALPHQAVHRQHAEDRDGMAEALPVMARLALKLRAGEPLGPPSEDGYLPTGHRLFHTASGRRRSARSTCCSARRGARPTPRSGRPRYSRVPPAPPFVTSRRPPSRSSRPAVWCRGGTRTAWSPATPPSGTAPAEARSSLDRVAEHLVA